MSPAREASYSVIRTPAGFTGRAPSAANARPGGIVAAVTALACTSETAGHQVPSMATVALPPSPRASVCLQKETLRGAHTRKRYGIRRTDRNAQAVSGSGAELRGLRGRS